MAEPWSEFTEKLGSLASKWTGYAAFGSFLLYLFGYLTLRFELSTYGVTTNLDILDEKYLFAGCRFLVFVVSSVPSVLVIVLPVVAIGYVPYRLVPVSVKDRIKRRVSDWCVPPTRLPLLGVVLGVGLIQFVLRRCFAFGNLLLRDSLPDEWLSSVLLTSDSNLALYFSGLVAGVFISGAILFCVLHRRSATSGASRFLTGLLVFLVGVEFLLLPVNYGVLISTQLLPRVTEISYGEKLPEGARIWLVWDSKDQLTYFALDPKAPGMLVTVPRKESKVRIIGYDDIFCELFSANHAGPRPCAR
jgi:hypothetical protein